MAHCVLEQQIGLSAWRQTCQPGEPRLPAGLPGLAWRLVDQVDSILGRQGLLRTRHDKNVLVSGISTAHPGTGGLDGDPMGRRGAGRKN